MTSKKTDEDTKAAPAPLDLTPEERAFITTLRDPEASGLGALEALRSVVDRMIAQQAPALTPAAEIRRRREEGREITLPFSGDRVRVRQVSFDTILRAGRLPDPLTPLVAQILEIDGKTRTAPPALGPENLTDWIALADAVTVTCFVHPRVVDPPPADLSALGEDEIILEDVRFEDRLHLSQMLFYPLDLLASFRPQQALDVGSLRAAAGDGTAGEPGDGDQGVGGEPAGPGGP